MADLITRARAVALNERLAEAVRYLQDQIEALTTLCNDLEEFAQHDGGCYLRHSGDKCDCGLLSTIKRLNERMGL
jgi:hypothetical protein